MHSKYTLGFPQACLLQIFCASLEVFTNRLIQASSYNPKVFKGEHVYLRIETDPH